jgi:hypothetical protein
VHRSAEGNGQRVDMYKRSTYVKTKNGEVFVMGQLMPLETSIDDINTQADKMQIVMNTYLLPVLVVK